MSSLSLPQTYSRRVLVTTFSMLLSAQVDAQSSDHGMHMPPANVKTAAAPVAQEKSACLDPDGKTTSTGSAKSSCAPQREGDGVLHPTHPVVPVDHTMMKGKDDSEMSGMDHSSMKDMAHSKMDGMDHSAKGRTDEMKGMDHSGMERMEGMDHSAMKGMDHSQMDMGSMNMQGGAPPANARDPDYSDGVGHGSMRGMDMNDDAKYLYVLFDNLEMRHSKSGNAQAVDAQAWYGGDRDKLWLKLDGEHSDGRLGSTRTEALWNHAIATYWGTQVGLRHDLGDGPTRDWAAIGVQGLAPYWFDFQATAYIGQSGRTALRIESEYELLLTQRLILQPDVEVNVYGKDDRARGIGSGLSDLDVGLRLRYEITRKFAPYVGVVWSRKFGKTADFTRAAGDGIQDTQLVAGVRIWF